MIVLRKALLSLLTLLLVPVLQGCDGFNSDADPAKSSGSWNEPTILDPRGQGLQELEGVSLSGKSILISGADYQATSMRAFEVDDEGNLTELDAMPLSWRTGYSATAVGDQIVVWGGGAAEPVSDGAIYEGEWRRIPPGPLASRIRHSAVSTGNQVIFYGGTKRRASDHRVTNTAVAFSPDSGEWAELPAAPIAGRSGQAAVWTGQEMIVWGGQSETSEEENDLFDGAALDLATESWRRIPQGPISRGASADAVWTGTEMLVWSGTEAASYDPTSNSWRRASRFPLAPRANSAVAWNGSELIVWGGIGPCGTCFLADGAAYDPESDTWQELPPAPLEPRDRHAAVPLPSRGVFFFGGCCGRGRYFDNGAVYNPG